MYTERECNPVAEGRLAESSHHLANTVPPTKQYNSSNNNSSTGNGNSNKIINDQDDSNNNNNSSQVRLSEKANPGSSDKQPDFFMHAAVTLPCTLSPDGFPPKRIARTFFCQAPKPGNPKAQKPRPYTPKPLKP